MAAVITSAQNTPASSRTSGQLLLLPRRGMPISFEQIEEYSRKHGDGSFAVDYTNTGKAYRDSAGRVRLETETFDGSGRTSYTGLIDPVAGYHVVLLRAEKVGYRVPFPTSGEGRFSIMDAADGQESPHKWKTETEDLGQRVIEGAEFKGTRILTIAEDEPRLTTRFDQWICDKFKLIGAVDRSGPYESYTVRIQNIRHEEPDAALFRIPADYTIVDVPLPPHEPQ